MNRIPLSLALTLAACASLSAQEVKPATPPTAESPVAVAAPTLAADDIVRAIKSDDSLSASAKAIKVMVTNNVITLHGAVTSIEERSTVESIARRAAGNMKVDSQLTLAPDK